MAFDKKNKKGRTPFEVMGGDGGSPFEMQARGAGKKEPEGKPGKSGKGGFMQALKNAKKKKGKR